MTLMALVVSITKLRVLVGGGTPSGMLPMKNRFTVSRTREAGVRWCRSSAKNEIPAESPLSCGVYKYTFTNSARQFKMGSICVS